MLCGRQMRESIFKGRYETITGMLRLYYITICTIADGKFTIGLYSVGAAWLLYYYA